MIYLDNAATTMQKPPCVIDAVCRAMQQFGNDGRGAHDGSLSASRTIYNTRSILCDLFGGDKPEHVVFTANSTEALNIAIHGVLHAGDHVISTDLEHNSVLRPLYRLAQSGVSLSFVPADAKGNISYDDFPRLLTPETKAIVCTHASNLTGTVVDLARIGSFAKAHNLLFLVDASQTAGALSIDMKEMNIDILCFTGHKGLFGPQGTGGLCVRGNLDIKPWKVGGSGVKTHLKEHPSEYPTRLEAGTLNAHGIAGLEAALSFLEEEGIDQIHEKEWHLAKSFYDAVSALSGVTVYGDFSAPIHAPIVTLNLDGHDCGAVSDRLMQEYGIATRPGAHCAPRLHRALGTEETGSVRFSFGYFNTEDDVSAAVQAIKEILG